MIFISVNYFNGVLVNVLDCDNIVSEFEIQSDYYVLFQTNTLGKSLNLLISPEMS